jgi:hypothetical protein
MRRRLLALAIAIAVVLQFAPAALATGPGGWDHVGVGATSGASSLNGVVTALNSENPGVLYAGGNFTSAGGNPKAKRVARWNGSTWSSLGTTPIGNGQVFALAYHAGKLYAGGTFLNAGGNPNADFLAVWDGSTWAPFCTSTVPGPAFTGNVDALQIIGSTLYVGGSFANGAGIASADYLLKCDLTTGTATSTVSADGDFTGAVYALTADTNGTLYAGGGFINLDGFAAADHVAAYNGSAWSPMGGDEDVDTFVRSLKAVGTDVYVGTDAVDVAGIAQADHVARWNGSAWNAVGSNTAGTDGWFPMSATIDALTSYGSNVFAAGSFQNANGIATADTIAYFDGTTWRPIGSDGAGNGPLNAHPTALAVVNGKLYVGGNFTKAGGDSQAAFIAAYALRQPDASIAGTSSGTGVGNNVYSSTGAGEKREVTVHRGHQDTSYVRIQNDGLVAASFSVKGLGGANGITAHWFAGSTNVTAQVQSGTYTTPTIAPRAHVVLRLEVHASQSSANSATILTVVHSTSGTAPDAVRLAVTAKN